jgi:hypothetical protein
MTRIRQTDGKREINRHEILLGQSVERHTTRGILQFKFTITSKGPLMLSHSCCILKVLKCIMISYIITNSMEESPSCEADSISVGQEILRLLWNPRFITVFSRALHWFLSWARWFQSTFSYPMSIRSILISYSRLRPDVPSDLFRFPDQNFVWIYRISREWYMPRPSRPPWCDHPNNIWNVRVQLWSPSLCDFQHPRVTFLLFGN